MNTQTITARHSPLKKEVGSGLAMTSMTKLHPSGDIHIYLVVFNFYLSIFRVKSGCWVQYWKGGSYEGDTGTAAQDTPWIGSNFNDKISSAKCAC